MTHTSTSTHIEPLAACVVHLSVLCCAVLCCATIDVVLYCVMLCCLLLHMDTMIVDDVMV
jgi:hypothetical protein